MIRHIVQFNFKEGVSDEHQRGTLDAFRALRGVPSIRSLELGTAVSTRSRHAGKFARRHAAVMTFDDIDGFHQYVEHPLHQAFDDDWVKLYLDDAATISGQFEAEHLK